MFLSGATPPRSSSPAQAPALALVPDVQARSDQLAVSHASAVRRMFDRISPTYDLLNRLLSFGIDQRWRAQALAALERDLPAGAVLDLCAGTLDLTAALKARFSGRAVLAIDFARDMLVSGRRKVPGAHLVVGDAMCLPVRTQALAGLICGFGMRNLADPKAGLREARRVLAPGGVVVVLEFFRPTRLPTRVFHALYGRVVLPLVGRLVSGDAEAYRYLSRSMQGFLTRDEYAAAMREAGFCDVTTSDLTFGVACIVRGVRPAGEEDGA